MGKTTFLCLYIFISKTVSEGTLGAYWISGLTHACSLPLKLLPAPGEMFCRFFCELAAAVLESSQVTKKGCVSPVPHFTMFRLATFLSSHESQFTQLAVYWEVWCLVHTDSGNLHASLPPPQMLITIHSPSVYPFLMWDLLTYAPCGCKDLSRGNVLLLFSSH